MRMHKTRFSSFGWSQHPIVGRSLYLMRDVKLQNLGDMGVDPAQFSIPRAQVLDGGLAQLNVPYSYGFAIILLTIIVKVLTFPLTKKQVRVQSPLRHPPPHCIMQDSSEVGSPGSPSTSN